MAECDAPLACPRCDNSSPRVILTAPNFFCMPSDKRRAHATNERSANAPKTLGEYKASHGPGCGCCSTKPSRLVKRTRSGAKSFPTARPWMISHRCELSIGCPSDPDRGKLRLRSFRVQESRQADAVFGSQQKISKTTPCKVAGAGMDALKNSLTRRANQRHSCIIAQIC